MNTTPNTQIAYLANGWLDQTNVKERAAQSMSSAGVMGQQSNLYNSWTTPTYYWPYTTTTKIRLTLSEVEHMRKCAAGDAKLKKTFQKLAPHIEVGIDFP